MTKIEKRRCEQLAQEAKNNFEKAEYHYEEYKEFHLYGNKTDAEIALRETDYHRGYAEGIYQALVVIGYNSESMKELSELI